MKGKSTTVEILSQYLTAHRAQTRSIYNSRNFESVFDLLVLGCYTLSTTVEILSQYLTTIMTSIGLIYNSRNFESVFDFCANLFCNRIYNSRNFESVFDSNLDKLTEAIYNSRNFESVFDFHQRQQPLKSTTVEILSQYLT